MKVILINPPAADNRVWVREGRCQYWDIWGAPFPPLSLALISTQLVNSGFETMIVDSGPLRLGLEGTLKLCEGFSPDLAIISSATPTLESDLDLFLSGLKGRVKDIKTAAIGIHVTALCRDVLLKYPRLDYVIAGEPEITAKELALAVSRNEPLDGVKGLAFRDAGGIVQTGEREFNTDLDSLGFPDWGKIDFNCYRLPIKDKKFSLVPFSRGCPFGCKYCAARAYNGRKLRKRSAESLIAEIRLNIGSFGVRDFLFWTEQMTMDRQYLDGFLDALLESGLYREISWVCNSRTDFVDAELLKKMKRCGCWQIAFGFEFGDDRMLKLVKKGGKASVARSKEAAALAAAAGLAVDGHFILGYPGEDRGTLEKTIGLACSLPLTFAHFYTAAPFPGSPLYTEAKDNNWLVKDSWKNVNQNAVSLAAGDLALEDLLRCRKKAYLKFYLRLKTALRILAIPGTPAEYFNLLKVSLQFLKAFLFCR